MQKLMPPWEISLKSPGTKHRNRLNVLAVMLITLLVASGCAPLLDPEYYLLPRSSQLFLYDDFTWSTLDSETDWQEENWIQGTTEGEAVSSAVHGGNFISVGRRNVLLSSIEQFDETRITVNYQVFPGLTTENNGWLFDYQIVLASNESDDTQLIGPSVELSLWHDFDSDMIPDNDELRIRADAGDATPLAETVIPYISPMMKKGVIEIDVFPADGLIVARLYSGSDTAVMEVASAVPDIPQPYYLALQASGDDGATVRAARTIGKVYVTALEVD